MEREALKVLGLDVGERRIGVAVSDIKGIVVSLLDAVRRSTFQDDLTAIAHLVEYHSIGSIVVGLPISLNGRIERQGKLVRGFIRALTKESIVPVHFHDERFSTVEAERLLREAGHQPSRNKGLLDSASAAVILRAYLHSQTRH